MAMLRTVRDLENFRVLASDGTSCGRVKDLYFDDQSWTIKYIVVALEPRQFGQRQVLIIPEQTAFWKDECGALQLGLPSSEVSTLPLATSVLPVCKQYASIAFSSPGASLFARGLACSDPHLRSAKAVLNYRVNVAGEFGGTLADFVLDDETWAIRYLSVEQIEERRKLLFHVLPQAVERFAWSTQRVLLRELEPVELAERPQALFGQNAA